MPTSLAWQRSLSLAPTQEQTFIFITATIQFVRCLFTPAGARKETEGTSWDEG